MPRRAQSSAECRQGRPARTPKSPIGLPKAQGPACQAKLDRLSRNVAFIATLMDSGVEFVACDNPHATRLALHILAAVAEHEREMISARTKAALQAAKARGVRLGRNAENLAPANHAAALDHANQIKDVLAELAGSGMSARQIAAELTSRGIPTARGGRWHPQNVIRAMQRVAL
jgi:DNA invertase Pin-like site-specific DNA recombinase